MAADKSDIDANIYMDHYSYRHPHNKPEGAMRTVQMTLDENLLRSVDRVVKKTHTTRSAFTRDALRAALTQFKTSQLEQQHQRGYETQPVEKAEFSVWENEQAWGDE